MKTALKLISILFFLLFFGLFNEQNSQTIFITKLSDLDFGDVFIGYPAEVMHIDPGAGKFSFYHTLSKRDVFISFNLPATLDNGPDNFPITFDASHTGYHTQDVPTGAKTLDPHSTKKIKGLKTNAVIYVWIGGQITTSAGLPYGLYSGTIILTVAY